jgi:WD40 repeat protein
VLSAGNEFVWAVAFSPNGKQIASTWMDKTIHVWDLMSGSEVPPPMRCGVDFAHLVAFSPNGQRIVCGVGNDLYEWDVLSGAQVLGPLLGHEDFVSSVVFSPNGTRITSGSEDGTIRVWNAASGYEMLRLLRENMGKIHSVVFSSDGQHIISGAADGMVCMWHANQAADAILVLKGHERDVMAVASSPDGNWIVSGSLDGTVRIWDTILGVQIFSWSLGALTIHDSMAFSSDGSQFVCTNSDRIVRVWDIGLWDAKSGSGEKAAFFQMPTTPLSIALSPDGMQFATAAAQTSGVLVYDMAVGMQNGSPQPAHINVSKAVAVSPDGSRVICGSQNSIRSWAVVSGDEISPMLIGHRGSISALAFSPDGRQIVSSSDDKTIRLWVTASGEESLAWSVSRSAESDKFSISSLAFSHQGTQIVSCSNKIHVWDVSTGSLIHCFDELASWACFSLDGTSIISRDFLAFDVRVADSQSGAVISNNKCFLEHCCNINNSIVLDEEGWIADKATSAVIGKLPNIVSVEGWAASRHIVAFTTPSSNLYIMHFPSCTLIGPGTYDWELSRRKKGMVCGGTSPS